MSRGRPPTSWLVVGSKVFVEVLEAKTRGRFTISAAAREGLSWLKPGGPVLGIQEEAGRVRLVSWELAEPVRARHADLTARSDEDAVDEILLLQDRYLRVEIDQDSRIDLPQHVELHLEVADGTIFLARYPRHVELWSSRYRQARLAHAGRSLRDLP